MEKYPFIFSDRLTYRLRRHLAFWGFWWIFQGILYSFIGLNPELKVGYPLYLADAMVVSLVFLIIHIFFAYSLNYFVLPRYLLKQKYWQTALWVTALGLTTAF